VNRKVEIDQVAADPGAGGGSASDWSKTNIEAGLADLDIRVGEGMSCPLDPVHGPSSPR
jgi:hypothetical protein